MSIFVFQVSENKSYQNLRIGQEWWEWVEHERRQGRWDPVRSKLGFDERHGQTNADLRLVLWQRVRWSHSVCLLSIFANFLCKNNGNFALSYTSPHYFGRRTFVFALERLNNRQEQLLETLIAQLFKNELVESCSKNFGNLFRPAMLIHPSQYHKESC